MPFHIQEDIYLLCRYFAYYQRHFEFQFRYCKTIKSWYLMLRFEAICKPSSSITTKYCTSQGNEVQDTPENPRRISLAEHLQPMDSFLVLSYFLSCYPLSSFLLRYYLLYLFCLLFSSHTFFLSFSFSTFQIPMFAIFPHQEDLYNCRS